MEIKEEECGTEEDKEFRKTITATVQAIRRHETEKGPQEGALWFTEKQVARANKKVKMKTAAGEDEVTPEMVKRGSRDLRLALADMHVKHASPNGDYPRLLETNGHCTGIQEGGQNASSKLQANRKNVGPIQRIRAPSGRKTARHHKHPAGTMWL